MKRKMDLLKEIIRCAHIHECLGKANIENPCYDIVNSQRVKGYGDFQVPEPWSGDLERAKILFISSNPSISKMDKGSPVERYPLGSRDDDEIYDFFTNRFSNERDYTKKGIYFKCNDGSYSSNWVHYWASVRKIAEGLLGEAIPGVNYSLTEVVHCKSEGENGASKALKQCPKLYLRKIVDKTSAQVIVVLGKKARKVVFSEYEMPDGENLIQVPLINRMTHFLFLPHPNARGKRVLEAVLSEKEIEKTRSILKE